MTEAYLKELDTKARQMCNSRPSSLFIMVNGITANGFYTELDDKKCPVSAGDNVCVNNRDGIISKIEDTEFFVTLPRVTKRMRKLDVFDRVELVDGVVGEVDSYTGGPSLNTIQFRLGKDIRDISNLGIESEHEYFPTYQKKHRVYIRFIDEQIEE